MNQPLLSIIIPAHNEEKRLPPTLEQVFAFLEQQNYEAEVLVIENGSTDRTYEIAQDFASQHQNLRVIRADGRGKGLAVQRGMLEARGQYRLMCDADLSMPVNEIAKFLSHADSGFDIAIASREAPGARRIDEPQYRHLMGRVFNLIVRILAIPGIQDTQCGFKVFRREVARDVFRLQTIDGWGFDVEMLFIARRHGYKLIEVPITWYYRPQTKISPIRDSINMVVEVLRVRLNGWRGRYARKN